MHITNPQESTPVRASRRDPLCKHLDVPTSAKPVWCGHGQKQFASFRADVYAPLLGNVRLSAYPSWSPPLELSQASWRTVQLGSYQGFECAHKYQTSTSILNRSFYLRGTWSNSDASIWTTSTCSLVYQRHPAFCLLEGLNPRANKRRNGSCGSRARS